jgi:hemoglobin/transferrin/lactoferrin receptor protein
MKKSLVIILLNFLFIFNIFCQKDTFNLDDVIISANKTEEKILKVAQQVKVIGSKQINFIQSQTPADLIQATGAAFVQKSQQGGGSPVLRGFEANKLLLIIDGVRMNNAIYRGGHLQNIITMDNNALERVEILYGPSSTIYGSDALGGVVHFFTKKPQFSDDETSLFKMGSMLRYGTVNNEKMANIHLNVGSDKLAFFTSVTASTYGDLLMGKKINPSYGKPFGERLIYTDYINGKDSIIQNSNKYSQKYSGYSQLDIVQKVSHKLSNFITHGLNFQLSTSTNIPRYDRLTDPSPTNRLNQAEWYYGPQKRLLLAYDLDKKAASEDQIGVHFGVNYQAIEESRINRRFNSSNQNNRIENLNIVGVNLDFLKIKGLSKFRFGVDGQSNILKSIAFNRNIKTNVSLPLDTRYPDGKNIYTQMGAYISHSIDLSSSLVLNDGLRLGFTSLSSTFISKQFFPFPFDEAKQSNFTYSGNLGLNYLIGSNSKISGSLATGFRAPNIDDIGKVFEQTPGTLIVPNSNLKPEQTLNGDLTFVYGLGKPFSFQAVIFNTRLRDAIVVDNATFNGESEIEYAGKKVKVLSSVNKRKATVSGLSLGMNLVPFRNFTFDVNATYTKGIIDDELKTPLDHIPPFYASMNATYNFKKFKLGLSTLYNGWKRIKDYNPGGEDNQQYATPEGMPSWYTLNLKTSYDLNSKLTFLIGVDNILDLQYRAFASGINGAGRNIYFTAKGNF